MIRVGTDCSGMEAPVQALRRMRVRFEHMFSSDICPHVRSTISANFMPGCLYPDLTTRDVVETPSVDLYIAGFPCQPFSSAGLQQGFQDQKKRGIVFFSIAEYLRVHLPRAFVLENVVGLTTLERGRYMKAVLEELHAITDGT